MGSLFTYVFAWSGCPLSVFYIVAVADTCVMYPAAPPLSPGLRTFFFTTGWIVVFVVLYRWVLVCRLDPL